ncbi:MAG TPA: FMN-binding protein [Candidatus Acidoferrales bacterium]|nr:FMN-binding protein [Candidatus Acidoferrales bacterium]
MDKSTLLLLAMVLAIFGGSVALGHPDWGTFTGLAIILLAGGLAAGSLPIRVRDFVEERAAPSQRVSNGLVTLSSAAIVAIYAAGYHRTSLAAHKFDLQGSQGRASAEVTAVVPPRPAPNPPSNASGAASQNAASAEKKPVPRPAGKATAPKSPAAGASAPTPSAGEDASASPETAAAPVNGETPSAHPAAATPRYKDGTFSGWGSCRHGDIEASVMIQGGKIASVVISQCLTRYSCNWIAPKNPDSGLPDLPAQVVQRQNTKVDYVSGATESSYAFADAVVAALSKATE